MLFFFFFYVQELNLAQHGKEKGNVLLFLAVWAVATEKRWIFWGAQQEDKRQKIIFYFHSLVDVLPTAAQETRQW